MENEIRGEVISRIRAKDPAWEPSVQIPRIERQLCHQLYSRMRDTGPDLSRVLFEWLVDKWAWYEAFDDDTLFPWPFPVVSDYEPPFSRVYQSYYAAKEQEASSPGPQLSQPSAATPSSPKTTQGSPLWDPGESSGPALVDLIAAQTEAPLGDWVDRDVYMGGYLHPSQKLWDDEQKESCLPFAEQGCRAWEIHLDPTAAPWDELIDGQMTKHCEANYISEDVGFVLMRQEGRHYRDDFRLLVAFRQNAKRTDHALFRLVELWRGVFAWYDNVIEGKFATFEDFWRLRLEDELARSLEEGRRLIAEVAALHRALGEGTIKEEEEEEEVKNKLGEE